MNGYTEKAIKAICRNKIDDLCKYISIMDKNLANEIKMHSFISGGAITSLLQGEEPNDFDIYIDDVDVLYKVCDFYTKQWNTNHKNTKTFNLIKHITSDDVNLINQYNSVLNVYYDHKDSVEIQVKSSGIARETDEDNNDDEELNILPTSEIIEDIDTVKNKKKEYTVRCITSNALSLSNDIQIICRFCGKPEEIFKNYDFIHTMQAYVRVNDELLLNTESLTSIMSKRLIYQGSLFPICSLFRIRKFLTRGWTISSTEILKIAYQVSKLDLDNIEILKEQLTGVDFFYFSCIISKLEQWRYNNPDIEFNSEYLFQILEEVFDKDYSLKEEV